MCGKAGRILQSTPSRRKKRIDGLMKERKQMQIKTERLLLRPFTEADAADLYKYARDPEVGPAAGWPPHAASKRAGTSSAWC